MATLRFASGGLATVSASTALTPGLGTRVLVSGPGGTAGVAEYPEGAEGVNDVWAVPGATAVRPPFGDGLRPDHQLSAINGSLAPFHALQIADFVDAVRTGREPAVTGRDAAASLAVLTALYASAKSGARSGCRHWRRSRDLTDRDRAPDPAAIVGGPVDQSICNLRQDQLTAYVDGAPVADVVVDFCA